MRWFRSGTKYGKSLTITGNNEKSGCKTAGKIGEILRRIIYNSDSITNKGVEKATSRKENEAYNSAANGGTYGVALKGNVPLSHPSNLVKANARNCHILIDKDPHVEQNNLDTLTERELVAKANEAI